MRSNHISTPQTHAQHSTVEEADMKMTLKSSRKLKSTAISAMTKTMFPLSSFTHTATYTCTVRDNNGTFWLRSYLQDHFDGLMWIEIDYCDCMSVWGRQVLRNYLPLPSILELPRINKKTRDKSVKYKMMDIFYWIIHSRDDYRPKS